MVDVGGSLQGFAGGVIAWFVTSFVAQPLLLFWSARTEAARALAIYEEFDNFDPERDSFPEDQAAERARTLRASGAQLIAFDLSHQFLGPGLRAFGLFPRRAGDSLILLAQMKGGGGHNDEVRGQVMKSLRLGRRFGQTRI